MSELKPEDVRSLLRECVTVVQPGEVLVLSFGPHFTPADAQRVREHVQWFNAGHGTSLAVLILADCELAVMPAAAAEASAETEAERRKRERIAGHPPDGA